MRRVCWRWSLEWRSWCEERCRRWGAGLARLLYLIVGGLVIGLLIGVVVGWLERFIDDGPVELVVSLVVPYAAYLAGETGEGFGRAGGGGLRDLYEPEEYAVLFADGASAGEWSVGGVDVHAERAGVCADWAAAAVCAGGDQWTVWDGTLIFYGAVFSAVLILLRMVWVFPAVKIASFVERRWLGHKDEVELKPREVFVVGWTGMRGVLALAAAISVPEVLWNGQPFESRNLIVFLAFCVILVTLVLQGLTLPALIRALGLAGTTGWSRRRERRGGWC